MDSESLTSPDEVSAESVVDTLSNGDLTILGQLIDASNGSLLCDVGSPKTRLRCIYKPRAGERPLWDFPTGTLSHREVAAYQVSEALNWQIVPPTVWRNGPFGPGMVQQWIDIDDTVDLVGLIRGNNPLVQRMSVFDVVINNADRKGGHILPTADGALYGIDHGVSFAEDDKLRTLLWQWEGEPIPPQLIRDLTTLLDELDGSTLPNQLREHLSGSEIDAMVDRIEMLRHQRVHPGPADDRPAIPWPPF